MIYVSTYIIETSTGVKLNGKILVKVIIMNIVILILIIVTF